MTRCIGACFATVVADAALFDCFKRSNGRGLPVIASDFILRNRLLRKTCRLKAVSPCAYAAGGVSALPPRSLPETAWKCWIGNDLSRLIGQLSINVMSTWRPGDISGPSLPRTGTCRAESTRAERGGKSDCHSGGPRLHSGREPIHTMLIFTLAHGIPLWFLVLSLFLP